MNILGINDIKRAHHAMDNKPLLYKVFVWGVVIGFVIWLAWEEFRLLEQYFQK